MIEKIHKYSGLLMAILVISAVAFIFGDFNRGSHAFSGGQPMMKIAGRTYNDKEFSHLGKDSLELASAIAGRGDFGIYQFIVALSSGATSREDSTEKFFTGRMIIRQAKEEFGVYPGEEEITAYLRNLRLFAGPDGKFDATIYQNFVKRALGTQGLAEKDLRELASDVLATTKIQSIIGAGLNADRNAVARNFELENQQISGELAKFDLAPFQEKIQPTEDEIKTYWETLKDSFTTEPKRKFTYIVATPAVTVEPAEEPEKAESLAEAAASEEAKKAAAKKKEEERAKRAADAAEARRKNQLELDTKVDDFVFRLEEQKGAGFEELAKNNGWEVHTTELFARTSPPKELDLTQRATSGGGKAIDPLFLIQATSDPLSKISQAIPVGENQWIVARLDGEEKSRPKTFEEARNDARAQYIAEKAVEAMKAAANEAATKIKASMAAGKSFEDAAKEAGIATTLAFADFTSTSQADGATQPQTLFQAARYVDPGTVADVITESDRAFVLYVAKREVVKKPDAEARLDAEVKNRSSENEFRAFGSWLAARIEDAKVEALYKR